MTPAVFLQSKPVAKHAKDIAVSADSPDKIEVRIGFEGFEKDFEGRVKRLIGIVHARASISPLKKYLLIETDEGGTV